MHAMNAWFKWRKPSSLHASLSFIDCLSPVTMASWFGCCFLSLDDVVGLGFGEAIGQYLVQVSTLLAWERERDHSLPSVSSHRVSLSVSLGTQWLEEISHNAATNNNHQLQEALLKSLIFLQLDEPSLSRVSEWVSSKTLVGSFGMVDLDLTTTTLSHHHDDDDGLAFLGVGWEYGLINENIKHQMVLGSCIGTHIGLCSVRVNPPTTTTSISRPPTLTNNNDEIQMRSFARSFSFAIDFVSHHQQPPTARLEWWSTLIRGVGGLGLIVLDWWTGWTNQWLYSRWWWLSVIVNAENGECIPTTTTTTNLQDLGL